MFSALVATASFASVLLIAYTTVLMAELVGDKSMYTIAALGLRFSVAPVFGGIAVAFMGKMLVAVMFGKALLQVPGRWPSLLSAAGFFACALFIWVKKPETTRANVSENTGFVRAAAISFSSLFFTEWCDTGQIAAAALAAHTEELGPVWLGGTLALITKGALAMIVGAKLSAIVPNGVIRPLASVSYSVLGTLSLVRLVVQ